MLTTVDNGRRETGLGEDFFLDGVVLTRGAGGDLGGAGEVVGYAGVDLRLSGPGTRG